MINILLFGAGVYVRGDINIDSSLGNIGGALVEASHQGLVQKVFILSSSDSSNLASKKINASSLRNLTVPLYADTLIDSDFVAQNNINAAIIAVPDHMHFKYIQLCASLRIHAIVVKPFVLWMRHVNVLLFQEKDLYGFVVS